MVGASVPFLFLVSFVFMCPFVRSFGVFLLWKDFYFMLQYTRLGLQSTWAVVLQTVHKFRMLKTQKSAENPQNVEARAWRVNASRKKKDTLRDGIINELSLWRSFFFVRRLLGGNVCDMSTNKPTHLAGFF